ncbi:hydantoinase B/oxoprolinase family protein [Paraburkholderia fungorum]|uniref:hydantoinase B/oxoprolinase family protein n=1 Tax=Paraburkholderia fungorum TaxID=134537 RepID=UPI00402B5D6E
MGSTVEETPVHPEIDPIKLEIIRTGLQSIPDLIEEDLTRTAYSPLIYEYKDYAVGLVDAQGRSIALARRGLTLFLTNIIGLAVKDGLEIYGKDGIKPGDVILSNHAGTIGQHLNNVVMYTPVFSNAGELKAFMAVIVHWIDIGGRYQGSCHGTDTTELAQEGLQLRTVRLYREGVFDQEMMRVIQYNSRRPDMLLGDIAAQHAACVRGRQLMENFLNRYGEETVESAIHAIWRNSAAAAKAAVAKIPEGVYEKSSFLDSDGVNLDDTVKVPIKIVVKDGEFIVDYSEINEELEGPFNSGRNGGGETCARIAFKYLFSPEEPANEGSFAALRVILPEGKFLSAREAAPMGAYSTPLPTVVDTIIAAMAPVVPDRVAGGHHASFGVFGFSGRNPTDGSFFSFFDTALGGWGGSQQGDGVGPYKSLIHGDTRDIPVESMEALYPLLVEEYRWRPDSAGPGLFRGGLGLNKTIRATAAIDYNMSFERSKCPPWGLSGGGEGEAGGAEVLKVDGTKITVQKISQIPLVAGDRVIIRTGGGGGFGNAAQRDPQAVLRDVRLGYVTVEHARTVYGVVIASDGEIDVAGTAERRASLSSEHAQSA